MNDEPIISMIANMISESPEVIKDTKGIENYATTEAIELQGKIIIRVVNHHKGARPYKDLVADYCRYVTSPRSGRRYLVAGNTISKAHVTYLKKMLGANLLIQLNQAKISVAEVYPSEKSTTHSVGGPKSKNWLTKLRDFYQPQSGKYGPVLKCKYDKIMTICAENVISITKPNQ